MNPTPPGAHRLARASRPLSAAWLPAWLPTLTALLVVSTPSLLFALLTTAAA